METNIMKSGCCGFESCSRRLIFSEHLFCLFLISFHFYTVNNITKNSTWPNLFYNVSTACPYSCCC